MKAITAYNNFVAAVDRVDACDPTSLHTAIDAAASALADADYNAA